MGFRLEEVGIRTGRKTDRNEAAWRLQLKRGRGIRKRQSMSVDLCQISLRLCFFLSDCLYSSFSLVSYCGIHNLFFLWNILIIIWILSIISWCFLLYVLGRQFQQLLLVWYENIQHFVDIITCTFGIRAFYGFYNFTQLMFFSAPLKWMGIFF